MNLRCLAVVRMLSNCPSSYDGPVGNKRMQRMLNSEEQSGHSLSLPQGPARCDIFAHIQVVLAEAMAGCQPLRHWRR
jgi:hypothetical protein